MQLFAIGKAQYCPKRYDLVASTKTLRIMKITAILLTVVCLQVSAGGKAQSISLSLKDEPIQKVFREIEKQTEYSFVYGDNFIMPAKRVSLQVKNERLEKVLEMCFKDQPITYTIVDKYIIVKPKAATSPPVKTEEITASSVIDISGKVTNKAGEPLAGATVSVKKTTISTTTDAIGNFTLSGIVEDAVLAISYVGHETQELKVNGKTSFLVKLKVEVGELNTVVVSTGYEDFPKERATGSFAKIDNTLLNQQAGTNILKRIEGVAPGILFDNNKSINGVLRNDVISIRGLSTINASLDPLLVMDGFIYEGSIANINPNDVENITILKDAAATSIWGARAGNGVIVIKTKKGQFNQKFQISFNSNIIVNTKPDFSYLPQMRSDDYIDVEQILFNQGYFDDQIMWEPYKALTPAVEIFLKRRNGLISANDSASQINTLKTIDSRSQFKKYIYRNSITQQHAVNFRGGSDNIAYKFSIAYDDNITELRSKQKKININVENIYRPVKNVQVLFGVYYTNSNGVNGLPSYGGISINGRQIPYLKLSDENGNHLSVANIYGNNYMDTVGGGKLLDWRYYPLDEYKHSKSTDRLQEIFANVGLQYKVKRYLSIDIKYQYQRQQFESEQVSDLTSFNARDKINLFSQIDYSTGVINYIVPKGNIRSLNNSTIESSTLRGQLNFNHSWGYHAITAIFGGEFRQANSVGDNSMVYGYNSDPLSIGVVDYKNPYPTFITGSYSFIPGNPFYTEIVDRFVSMYTNASYSYKSRYIFSLSARRDGSNIFGASTNDRWKPLWSGGAAWKISDERFYKSDLIPILRFRSTYGYSGNVDLSKSAVAVGNYFSAPTTNFNSVRINVINNPELRWEKIGMFNIGIDFAFKGNIISGTVEYYQKRGIDLYGPSPLDYTTWGIAAQVTKNVANMQGQGIDLVINSKNIDKEIKWSTNFIFNYNTDKVTKYYSSNANDIMLKISSGASNISPVIGKRLYSIAAFKWGGLDGQGNPQGFLNGQLSTDYSAIFNEANLKGVEGNVVYIGSATPSTFGAIINNFQWKRFQLSANITYKLGYYFRKSTFTSTGLVSGNGHTDYEKRWQKAGDEDITNIPAFKYPVDGNRDMFYLFSEINILKGDHIRLQYINLSYSINKTAMKEKSFQNIELYVNASNVGIIWRANNQKLDPEYPTSLPPAKSWAFGVRGNF